jgi:hypothetical protein
MTGEVDKHEEPDRPHVDRMASGRSVDDDSDDAVEPNEPT